MKKMYARGGSCVGSPRRLQRHCPSMRGWLGKPKSHKGHEDVQEHHLTCVSVRKMKENVSPLGEWGRGLGMEKAKILNAFFTLGLCW